MIRLATPFLGLLGMEGLTKVAMAENAAENPMWHVICSDSKLSAEADGLVSAMKAHPAWPKGLSQRLLNTDDLSDPASALGELRTYGMLARAGFEVRPIERASKATPDLAIGLVSGDEVFVEVATRRLSGPMERRLKLHQAALQDESARKAKENFAKGRKISFTMREIAVQPFESEKQKLGDTPLTDAVSKIAAIKSRLTQLEGRRSSIFWLDMMDPVTWRLAVSAGEFQKTYHVIRRVRQSGSVWHAFFGRKGDELLEYMFTQGRIRLAHDGKYVQSPWLSAAVITTAERTVIYENPQARSPLPSAYRSRLKKLPRFDAKRSQLRKN